LACAGEPCVRSVPRLRGAEQSTQRHAAAGPVMQDPVQGLKLDAKRMRAVQALLRPRAIALVGVSPKGGAGARILESNARFACAVPTWPVNPNYREVAGQRCYQAFEDLPERPDCVVVSVPAEAVLDVVGAAAAAGIRGAFVISEGFADAATDAGRALQERLAGLAEASNMALAGPNCMGIASLRYGFAATMADIPLQAVSGGISLVSQSGGLLNSFAELTCNRGIGVNYLVSSGNEAGLEMADYIAYLADDPATTVIACILEGAKHGRRFRAAVEQAARSKPMVVLKLGRSEFGQRATLAHTGTLAGRHEAFAALFRQNGVALVESIDALVETAALFDLAPLPRGDRVVMMTVSGGATSLIADLGEAAGVNFPAIPAATNRRLQEILGVERAFGNPLDTVGLPRLRRDGNITAVLQALLEDARIDVVALVLGMRADGWDSHQDLVDRLAAAARGSRKPVLLLSFMSNSLTRHWRGYAQRNALPLLEDLERGLAAIRHLVDYAAFRRRVADRQARPQAGIARLDLAALHGRRTLTETESKKILAQAGLPVTRERLARSPAEAVRFADEIGGAVALKIQSPDIPHKSDIGGVRLGASTPAEVETAARQVLENAKRNCPDAAIDGILVQEMLQDGVEFILGMTYDPQFGPLILCGAGGVTVEVFKDVAVLLPPIEREDVTAALMGLKVSKLLYGFRGAPPRDVDALVECCQRFATFVVATEGSFAAIDLNPVFVCARGCGVRIADALIEMMAACATADHATVTRGGSV
jgi:acyl-CoA synthetase (NDP forming)